MFESHRSDHSIKRTLAGRLPVTSCSKTATRLTQLAAVIGLLGLFNAITSSLGNYGAAPPSTVYIIFKLALFAVLVSAIWRLGPSRRGKGLKAAKPDALLTLRAFACALVLLGHYFMVYRVNFVAYPWVRLLVSSPWAGVWVFFVLSGYLMGKGFSTGRYDLSHAGLSNFFRNRALRILPAYLVVLTACALIFTPRIFLPQNWWILSEYLTFDFKGATPLIPNAAAWSISTEVQFYFLVPFLWWMLKSFGTRSTLAIMILLPAASMTFLHAAGVDWFSGMYTPVLANLPFFICGMAANNLVSRSQGGSVAVSRQTGTQGGLIVIAVFYIMLSIVTSYTALLNQGYYTYMTIAPVLTVWISAALIYLFENFKGPLSGRTAALVSRMEIFGAMTYCIYLAHEPVFILIRRLFGSYLTLMDKFAVLPLVIVAVSATSFLLYRLVEKKFDRLRFGHEKMAVSALGVDKH